MAEGWLICNIIHWCIFNFIFSCYAGDAKIFSKLLGVILFSLVLYTSLKTIKNEDELNKFIKENMSEMFDLKAKPLEARRSLSDYCSR